MAINRLINAINKQRTYYEPIDKSMFGHSPLLLVTQETPGKIRAVLGGRFINICHEQIEIIISPWSRGSEFHHGNINIPLFPTRISSW